MPDTPNSVTGRNNLELLFLLENGDVNTSSYLKGTVRADLKCATPSNIQHKQVVCRKGLGLCPKYRYERVNNEANIYYQEHKFLREK